MSYTIDGKFIKKPLIEGFDVRGQRGTYQKFEYTDVIISNNPANIDISSNESGKLIIKFINLPLSDTLDNIKNNSRDRKLQLILKVDNTVQKASYKNWYEFDFSETEDSFIFTSLDEISLDIDTSKEIKISQIKNYQECWPDPHTSIFSKNKSEECATTSNVLDHSTTMNIITRYNGKSLYPVISGSEIQQEIILLALNRLVNDTGITREHAIQVIKLIKDRVLDVNTDTYTVNTESTTTEQDPTIDTLVPDNKIDINRIILAATTTISTTMSTTNTTNTTDTTNTTNTTAKMISEAKRILVSNIAKHLYHNLKDNNNNPTSIHDYFLVRRGPTGRQGSQGPPGPEGLIGNPGPEGIQGIRGQSGPQGSRHCISGNNPICLNRDHIQYFIDIYNLSNKH